MSAVTGAVAESQELRFLDINCRIGSSPSEPAWRGASMQGLAAELRRAGIAGAVVSHRAALEASPQAGNRLLAEALAAAGGGDAPGAGDAPVTWGAWYALPPATGEQPEPEELFRAMARERIAFLRLAPGLHRFVLSAVSMGPLLEVAVIRKVPFLLSVKHDLQWAELYALMEQFPELVVVVADHGCWGDDRYFRPLVERYPNLSIELSNYLLDGGIEAFVERYGAGRMLFGSGFPDLQMGGMMLALRHAEIPWQAKEQIASGNLARILEEERLDR